MNFTHHPVDDFTTLAGHTSPLSLPTLLSSFSRRSGFVRPTSHGSRGLFSLHRGRLLLVGAVRDSGSIVLSGSFCHDFSSPSSWTMCFRSSSSSSTSAPSSSFPSSSLALSSPPSIADVTHPLSLSSLNGPPQSGCFLRYSAATGSPISTSPSLNLTFPVGSLISYE